jgi:RNA polymerase sigma factor (sigma-70 family)
MRRTFEFPYVTPRRECNRGSERVCSVRAVVTKRDQRILDACRRGDADAWRELLDRYERLVFSVPLNYGLSRQDAADVCQVTFTILLQSLDTIRLEERLGSWLATVARRQTWRLMDRSRHEIATETPPEPGTGDNPSDVLEELLWLYEGLRKLDRRCRDLLVALYFDSSEPTYADVASRLGRPLGSIGPTRARCLERLRAVLGEFR